MEQDLEKLSKEELIFLLKKKNEKIQKTEIKLQKNEVKLQKSKAQAELLAKELAAVRSAVIEGIKTNFEQIEVVNKIAYIDKINDILSCSLVEQVQIGFAELNKWIIKSKSYLAQTEFGGAGRDGKLPCHTEDVTATSVKELQELQEKSQNLLRSVKESDRQFKQFFKNFTDLAKNTPLEGTVGESIKECFNVNISVAPIKDQVKGKGRQKRNTTKAITNIYTNLKASTKCPRCKGKLIPLGEIEQRIIQNNVKFQDLRNELNKQTDINNIMLCADCGKIVIPYSPKQNFPVKPNRSITMSELIHLCEMMYRGLPLNNNVKYLRKDYEQLGSDTMSYNIHDFVDIYLKPIYNQIEAKMQKQKIILADETPLRALQLEGRGSLSEEQKHDDNLQTGHGYILAITTPAEAKERLAYYRFIHGRGNEAIENVITADYEFDYLVCDGYKSYDHIVAAKPNRKLQNCLVHFRRTVIDALNPKAFVNRFKDLSEEEEAKLIREEIINEKEPMLLFVVYDAIKKIYEIERYIDDTGNRQNLEFIKKQRLKSEKLMNVIDVLMTSLAKTYIAKNEKGTRWHKTKQSPYAKPCLYYFNRWESLKLFISEPMVSPDSNLVEGIIRPITIFRKNINFKQNTDYAQDLAIIYTVFQTAAINGQEEICENLKQYSNALHIHCLEKGWEEYLKEGNEFKNHGHIVSWDMNKLKEDFNFSNFKLI